MSFSFNYLALLNHTELTTNHGPKSFLLCTHWLNLIFPFPFSTTTLYINDWFYDLSASIVLSCQDHFRPWLCHCTCLLLFPVSAFRKCDQLSSMFPFKSLIAMKTDPRSLPQQIALQFDMNPLITTLLSHSARCKSTWPQHCKLPSL